MGKGRKVLLLTLLALAAVEGGIWWLAADSAGESGATRGTSPAVFAAPKLPESLAAGELPESIATEGAAQLAPVQSAAAPLDEGDVRAPFTGRVVDGTGRPIAGAVVHHYPSFWMRQKQHMLTSFGATLELARLAHTTTDADGHFTLDVTDHPPEPGAVAAPVGEQGWASVDQRIPSLLVAHPNFATRLVACPGWTGGPYAASDIVMLAGASLHGRVVNEQGGPLAGVSVTPPRIGGPYGGLGAGDWWLVAPTLLALTDADGRFVFDGLWTGPYSFDLRLAGWRTARLDVQLQAGSSRDAGDIVLHRGAVIEGQVADAEGRPVPHAHLLARPAGWLEAGLGFSESDVRWQFTIRTSLKDGVECDVEADADELGAFRFDSLDVANAPFHVYAGAPGFEVVRSPPTAPSGDPLVIELPRAGSVLLTVVDPESGEPILGATVKGEREIFERDAPIPLEVTSDPQALEAAGVPPPHAGLYLLSPAGPRANTAVISAPGHATRGYILPTVTAPERATFRVKLPREARAAGLVVDVHEQPIAGATVNAVAPESLRVDLPPVAVQTDASGRFVLGQLAGGEWTVTASAHGFVTSPPRTVSLRKGQATEDVRIVLEPAGAIAGVVLQAGQPLRGARVRALSVARAEAIKASKTVVRTTPTGTSYTFNPNPLSGEYQAVADTEGRFRFDDLQPEAFTLDGPPGVSVVVNVRAGETTEVTLLARNKPHVRGRVTDAGVPVNDAYVDGSRWIEPHSNWTSGDERVRTDPEGRFDLELNVPGRYRIGARQGTTRTNAVELELAWDQTEWQDLAFPSGVVRGRVVDAAGGKPVGGAAVALADAAKVDGPFRAAGSKRTTYTGADGRFEFTRVPAAAFAVFVVDDGHIEPPAVRVDVPDGGAPPELLIKLSSGGRIRGHVAALNGAALPEKLRVRATGLDGQPDVASAAVKKDGTFQCTQLAPGRWRCELAVDETAPPLQTREATVAAGEVASAEFEVAF